MYTWVFKALEMHNNRQKLNKFIENVGKIFLLIKYRYDWNIHL